MGTTDGPAALPLELLSFGRAPDPGPTELTFWKVINNCNQVLHALAWVGERQSEAARIVLTAETAGAAALAFEEGTALAEDLPFLEAERDLAG